MKSAKRKMQKSTQMFRRREPEFYNTLVRGLYAMSSYIKKYGDKEVTFNIIRGVYATK